jgi:hypothetical protein
VQNFVSNDVDECVALCVVSYFVNGGVVKMCSDCNK